jgi:hypothetical protein
MISMAISTTMPITRSLSTTAAAARLVPSSKANQTRSLAMAAPQPSTRGTGRPATSMPPV